MLFTKTEIEDGLRSLVTELVSTNTEVTLQIVGGVKAFELNEAATLSVSVTLSSTSN